MAAETLLLGRITYQGFAAAWPSMTPEWNNSTVINSDVPGEVSKLSENHGGDVLVGGSAQLVQTLLDNDLVTYEPARS
jgi:dihydrofolate reductase